jgi:hypothetical protein
VVLSKRSRRYRVSDGGGLLLEVDPAGLDSKHRHWGSGSSGLAGLASFPPPLQLRELWARGIGQVEAIAGDQHRPPVAITVIDQERAAASYLEDAINVLVLQLRYCQRDPLCISRPCQTEPGCSILVCRDHEPVRLPTGLKCIALINSPCIPSLSNLLTVCIQTYGSRCLAQQQLAVPRGLRMNGFSPGVRSHCKAQKKSWTYDCYRHSNR